MSGPPSRPDSGGPCRAHGPGIYAQIRTRKFNPPCRRLSTDSLRRFRPPGIRVSWGDSANAVNRRACDMRFRVSTGGGPFGETPFRTGVARRGTHRAGAP
jgi:hypothetical protein